MRRGVRDAGRRARGELLAQHRNDVRTQDVQLFEHGRERQPGVVHQEQLPLVVTREVPEGERLVDHLLRAADGQGGQLAEVLQRRAVAVDRGVVEVRAELAHRVLRVLPHEHLTAKAHDRLVGRAVAVVLEAPPVQLDHPPDVPGVPEDVVVEEAVAVERRLLGDLRAADRRVPDERRHAVERTRNGREALQRGAVPAVGVHDVLAPEPAQQRVVLDGERDAVADVLAEPRVDRAGVAPAQHQVHPPVGEVLQHRVVLGDLHRVVRGDQGGRRRQLQALRARRDVAEHRGRRGGDERRVVVLPRREDVEANLLGLQRDGDHRLDPLRLGGCAPVRRVGSDVPDGEDAELHSHLDPCLK